MFLLETSSNVVTRQRSLVCRGVLFLKKDESKQKRGANSKSAASATARCSEPGNT